MMRRVVNPVYGKPLRGVGRRGAACCWLVHWRTVRGKSRSLTADVGKAAAPSRFRAATVTER
jgi:hypothetical protein